VWAVADGTVVSYGWNSGYGKQVILRHGNGYRSYYGHLSGYGAGIRKGMRVKQAQVIGYVGSTGLSTGPHLDYRFEDGCFETFKRVS
jgi:murein DD-endopeptidase MepM/ murein hydrolase activator NlpD